MRKRILLTTLLITFLGLTLFSLVTTNLSYRSLLENSKNFLRAQMNVFSADEFSNDTAGAQELSRQLGGARVTFLDLDGTVTGDSAGTEVGQARADREEVKIAMLNGEGASTRRSDTVGKDLLYFCKKFDDRMVRLAIETSSEWDVILNSLPTIAWFLAIDIVFCLIFTYFTTAYTLKPVEELAKKSRLSAPLETKYKELYPIAEILNRKNEEIERQMDVIKHEQARVASAQESKNEFISNITHEMNTPLTSIKGFAELLESGNLDEDTKLKAVRIIKAQSDRLSGLIACIINYNELDNDELPAYECNVSAIAREVAESLQPSIEQKGLTLTLDIDPDVTVASRHERLTEIFGNLIRNATRYNKPEGSISVSVKGGTDPYAEVSDAGIGIAEENLDKIFSRFFTVDKSHNGKNGGFGLGLAVVKKLCDRAGWKLTVTSKLDEGTTFRIYF